MTIIIHNDVAFRIRQDGQVETASVAFDMKRAKWELRSPSALNMTGGDFEFIQQTLDRMRVILADEKYRPPSWLPKESRVERAGDDAP